MTKPAHARGVGISKRSPDGGTAMGIACPANSWSYRRGYRNASHRVPIAERLVGSAMDTMVDSIRDRARQLKNGRAAMATITTSNVFAWMNGLARRGPCHRSHFSQL